MVTRKLMRWLRRSGSIGFWWLRSLETVMKPGRAHGCLRRPRFDGGAPPSGPSCGRTTQTRQECRCLKTNFAQWPDAVEDEAPGLHPVSL
eukprot:6353732-Amphidinium_carterae.1